MAQAALEIIMFALKARAQIEPRTLFECRRTARLLSQSDGKRPVRRPSDKGVSAETLQVQCLGRILSTLCEQEILSAKIDTFGSVYWLSSAAGNRDKMPTLIADDLAKNLVVSCYARDKGPRASNLALVEHFKALTGAFDVDLIPRASDFAMFSEPEVIATKEDFDRLTKKLLSYAKSQIRLCVSTNTGEWIATHKSRLNGARIKSCQMIVEDLEPVSDQNPFRDIAEERRQQALRVLELQGIRTELRVARNKTHQLTAIFNLDDECVGSIYFRREGKSTRISPVWLSKKQDLELVERMWKHLWSDAKRFVDKPAKKSANPFRAIASRRKKWRPK